MKSYYIYTYGCQMNTADSERLSHQLESVGYIPTENVETADLILLNTCAVRENAETKVYGRIGELKRLKRNNKNLIIAVTGCMAQKNQAEMFKRAPHIDIVLGTHNIQHINEMIEEVQHGHRRDAEHPEQEVRRAGRLRRLLRLPRPGRRGRQGQQAGRSGS